MAERHHQALLIVDCAVRDVGRIAEALAEACREACAEGVLVRKDAAIRLMVVHLVQTCRADCTIHVYANLLEECGRRAVEEAVRPARSARPVRRERRHA